MTNALDAMKRAPVRELTVMCGVVRDHVEIVFQDTGAGIAPGVLPRVFDPFLRRKKWAQGPG